MPGAAPGLASLHSKYEWACVDSNANTADWTVVEPAGPLVTDVCGAIVSTVNVRVAGDATTPAGSVARTQNVYMPSTSGPYGFGDTHGA